MLADLLLVIVAVEIQLILLSTVHCVLLTHRGPCKLPG